MRRYLIPAVALMLLLGIPSAQAAPDKCPVPGATFDEIQETANCALDQVNDIVICDGPVSLPGLQDTVNCVADETQKTIVDILVRLCDFVGCDDATPIG